MLPAMECHLECEPGFAPSIAAMVSCVEGRYIPNKPSEFSCNPAAAIIVTSEGEVETFSGEPICNKIITNIPPHVSTSQTVNVFKNHLVIVGYSVGEGTWNYLSLEDPISSLLSNPWTVSTTVGELTPQSHTSFSHGRSLILIGGSQESALKMDVDTLGGNWNSFSLQWSNGTNFTRFTSSGCGVRVTKNNYLIIGGINIKTKEVTSNIVNIDIKNMVVHELPGLRVGRALHACEVVDRTTILVTGGRTAVDDGPGSIAPDEKYNLTTEISSYSDKSMVIPRYNHRLVLLGDTVFAIGGRMANKSEVNQVERYSSDTSSWEVLSDGLLSHSTGDLAVATIARSSLDCDVGCSCGVGQEAGGDTRVGGFGCEAQVQVISIHKVLCCTGELIPMDWTYSCGYY